MSDSEEITLSSYALAALQEFQQEQKAAEQRLNQLEESDQVVTSMDVFTEDWQLSQFWCSDATADIFAKELFRDADSDTVICVASAPAVYAAMNRIPKSEWPTDKVYLLEYDTRFKLLSGDDKFFFYDYNTPDEIPSVLKNKVHRLLIDPPFLEEECQLKSSQAAHNLLVKDKTEKTKNGGLKYKLISSTGERMKDVIKRIYPDTSITDFFPEHTGLKNEFRCYATFECPSWKFRED